MAKRATPEGRVQQIVNLLRQHPNGLTAHEIAEVLNISHCAAASVVRAGVRLGLLGYYTGQRMHPRGNPRHRWYVLEQPLPALPPRSRQKRTDRPASSLDSDDGWLTAAKAAVAERRQFATQRARV